MKDDDLFTYFTTGLRAEEWNKMSSMEIIDLLNGPNTTSIATVKLDPDVSAAANLATHHSTITSVHISDGKLHRLNGPAIKYDESHRDSDKYFIHGKQYADRLTYYAAVHKLNNTK